MRKQEVRPATLPGEYVEHTLANLRVGESTWTVPWAMDVDDERRCWLTPSFTGHPTPGGTVQMLVERREDGYHVWLAPDYKYHPTGGRSGSAGIPVVKLHRGDTR